MDSQKLLPMCVNPEPGSWSWAASLCDMDPPSEKCSFVLPALSSAFSATITDGYYSSFPDPRFSAWRVPFDFWANYYGIFKT